jgi:hypothetical protein
MKIYNKTFLFVGFVLMAVPNWFPQYEYMYRYFIQLIGFILTVWAFKKPKSKK